MHGELRSAWAVEGGRLTLDVRVPANTTATVHVPTSDAAQVREGDGAATEAEGVTFLRIKDDRAIYRVASGRYRFTAPVGR